MIRESSGRSMAWRNMAGEVEVGRDGNVRQDEIKPSLKCG